MSKDMSKDVKVGDLIKLTYKYNHYHGEIGQTARVLAVQGNECQIKLLVPGKRQRKEMFYIPRTTFEVI